MEIRSIEIKNITGSRLKGNFEHMRHRKTLPCLSVVQAIHGCYEIGLSGNASRVIEEGGAFVAPAGVTQDILHHNGADDYMEAQWVFLNIIINDLFAFEDVFDVPTILSAAHRDVLSKCIFTIGNSKNLCRKYAAAYELTDLLIAQSAAKPTVFDSVAAKLKRYIDKHYSEKITKEELASVAICSVPNLYRVFQKHFHLSPHNYVNKIRLEKASLLLENCSLSVAMIAETVGFDDPIYFSKLFKEQYHLSPKNYRESLRPRKGEFSET